MSVSTAAPFQGLLAASLTPFHPDGSLHVDAVAPMAEHLLRQGIVGIYVNGSTGEGPSLTSAERLELAEAWVRAIRGRVPVMVQVGHTSLEEAAAFADHARDIGADILSACPPFYFPVGDEDLLIDILERITSAAPELPFYYYHIPRLTGARLNMVRFLERAQARLPSLAGIKFSDALLHEFIDCQHACDGAFEIMWGVDEMSLAALATGARAFIGSTYNLAAPLYQGIFRAFAAGDLEEARRLQQRSVDLVNLLNRHGGFHASLKAVLAERGLELGGARLPLPGLSPEGLQALLEEIARFDAFDELCPVASP